MKNLKTILLSVFGMMAIAISFTSCNTDSTDYSIDYQTQKQYQSTMANMYSGKMRVYYADAQKQQYVKYDSVQTRWTVRTDSTLTVSDFPVSVLDSCINLNTPYAGSNNQEVQKLRSLKEAIGKLDTKLDLKCYYYVPTTSFVTSSAISFFVNPIFFKQTLEYDGGKHDVYFVFLTNNFGGNYNYTTRTFEFNMYLNSITFDKAPVDFYNQVSKQFFRNLLFTCLSK